MRLIGAASTVFALVFMLVLSGANRSVGANPHDGREIFSYDTFGDEQLWTDVLRMHEVVQNVSPETALNMLGLKVDVQALPQSIKKAMEAGLVNLSDPAVTRQLLTLNAVVGRHRHRDSDGQIAGHRHHLRALPLDGRRLLRARHRPAARRMAKSGLEPRPHPQPVPHRPSWMPRRSWSSRTGDPASTMRGTTPSTEPASSC